MRKILSCVVGILLLTSIFAMAFNIQSAEGLEPPEIEWTTTYGGTDWEEAWCVVQTDDGGYAVAGSVQYPPRNFLLVKIESNGDLKWSNEYGGSSDDWAYSVIQTDDGGYIIAGETRSFGAGNWDFWVVKTNSTGNIEWNETYGGAGVDVGHSIVQTSDGGYAVAGQTESFGNGRPGSADVWLVKIHANGTHQWNATYGGLGDEDAWSLVATDDGGYALGGFTESFSVKGRDFYLVRTNSSGEMEWNMTYGVPSRHEHAWSMIQTVDKGYALAGASDYGGVRIGDLLLIKVDSSGNMQWNETYGGADQDYAHSVIQTCDGGYAVAGWTMSFGEGLQDLWLVKTDTFGMAEWNLTCGGAEADAAMSLVQADDGGFTVAGMTTSFGVGESDIWLIKLASEISWEYVFEDTCRDTLLRINTDDGYFQFIAPDKTFCAKQDESMRIWRDMIIIWYGDEEMTLFAMINTRFDYCFAIAYDKMSRETYLLIDKPGIE